jgi:hypothetical protein
MNNIKNLITKYKNQNREILDRRPELSMYGDFTPDGIRFFCNSSFIEDLQAINHKRCSLQLKDRKETSFLDWRKDEKFIDCGDYFYKNGDKLNEEQLLQIYEEWKHSL